MYEWICAMKVHVPKHPLQFQIDEAARGLLTYCATLDTVIETSAADVQQLLKFHMLPARVQFFAAWEGTYLQWYFLKSLASYITLSAWQKATNEIDSKAKQQPNNTEAKRSVWKDHIADIYKYD